MGCQNKQKVLSLFVTYTDVFLLAVVDSGVGSDRKPVEYRYKYHKATHNYISRGIVSQVMVNNAAAAISMGMSRDEAFAMLFARHHESSGSVGTGVLCGMMGQYGRSDSNWVS